MYFPKSQIKSNLHTNGNEYVLATTKQPYVGYYFQTSYGNKYTGKTPQDGPNIKLITYSNPNDLISYPSTPSENDITLNNSVEAGYELYSFLNFNLYPRNSQFSHRSIPQYTPTLPTDKDKSLGAFSRYFCKKNNELIYLEISQQTYSALLAKSSTIAWDLYTAITTIWYIKGNKEKTYKANKGLISLIEQRQKWYGFSQYLKEDFLKYYLGE